MRPGQRLVFLARRLGHDFELGDAGCALPVGCAHAIGPGIAPADHDHVLVRGHQAAARRGADFVIACIALVLLGQEFHRESDAGQFRARNIEPARFLRAAGQHDCIEIFAQRLEADVHAHFARRAKLHTFCLHLYGAAINQVLFHLEVGDAVAQQAAKPIRLLEHGHGMAYARQLLRARKAGRARSDDGHRLAGLRSKHQRLDPAFGKAAIDDRAFDRLDGDRRIDDVQRTSRFARSRAYAPGKLGKIVGGMKHLERLAPVVFIDQMVPVRDDVVHRAAVVAKGYATIHAARSLSLQRRGIVGPGELLVMAHPLCRIGIGAVLALVFEKARFLTHYSAASIAAAARSFSSALSARA